MLEYAIQLYVQRAKAVAARGSATRSTLLSRSPPPVGRRGRTASSTGELDFRSATEAFRREVRGFLAEHLTDEIVERAHATGTMHDGACTTRSPTRGYLAAGWPTEVGGGGRSAGRDDRAHAGAVQRRRAGRRHGHRHRWSPPRCSCSATSEQRTEVAAAAARRRRAALPRLQRARRRQRRRRRADPGRARRRPVGHQRPEDVHDDGPRGRLRVPAHPHDARTSRSTRASRCSSCRWTRPASRSPPCTRSAASARTSPSTTTCGCPTAAGSATSTPAGRSCTPPSSTSATAPTGASPHRVLRTMAAWRRRRTPRRPARGRAPRPAMPFATRSGRLLALPHARGWPPRAR